MQKQPSVGNVLARTSSFGSSGSPSPAPSSAGSGSGVQRQGSQGSIFEQFASQAKELVRETTRQSSQDGLLAQMDKVLIAYTKIFAFSRSHQMFFQLKLQAKERLNEAEDSNIFAPFDKVNISWVFGESY